LKGICCGDEVILREIGPVETTERGLAECRIVAEEDFELRDDAVVLITHGLISPE
jgi:hypothetical protein